MTTDPPDGKLPLLVDGTRIDLDVTDIDRREWRLLVAELGIPQPQILGAFFTMDLDAIAGVLWLVLRRENPDLVFDDVGLSLRNVIDGGAAEAAGDVAHPA